MESASNLTFNILFPKYANLTKTEKFQTNESIENYIKNQLPLQVEVVKKLEATFSSFLNQYSNLIVKRPQTSNLSYSLASKATDLLEKLFKQMELKCQKQNKQNLNSAFQQLNPRRGIEAFRTSMKQLQDLIRQKYINNSGIPREQQQQVTELLYKILQIYHFAKSDLVTIASKHQLHDGKICDLALNNRTVQVNEFFELAYVDQGFKEYINSIVQKRCRPFYHKKDFFNSKIKEVIREAEGRLQSRSQPSALIFMESLLSKQKHRITKLAVPQVQNILRNFNDTSEQAGCRDITERVESLKRKFMQIKNNSYYIDIIRGDFTKKYKMELTKLENLYYLSNIEKYLQDVMQFVDELLKLEESIIENRKSFKQTLSSKVESQLYQICQTQGRSRQRLSEILGFYFAQLENLLYIIENKAQDLYREAPKQKAVEDNYMQDAKRNREEQQRRVQQEKRKRNEQEAQQKRIRQEQRRSAQEARKLKQMEEQQKRKEKIAKQKAEREKLEQENRRKAEQQRKKRSQQMQKRQRQLQEKKKLDDQRKKSQQKQKKEIQQQKKRQDQQKRKKQQQERKKRIQDQERIKKQEQEKKKIELQKRKKDQQQKLKRQQQQRKKRQTQQKKKKDEEERKRKQDELKRNKDLEQKKKKEDQQKKRKQQEDRKLKQAQEKKKRDAEQKRKKQDEQRLKKQSQQKKRKQQDEKRKKQQEDRKRKEQQQKKRKEAQQKKRKQEEQKRKRQEQEKKKKEAEEKKRKQEQDLKKKNQQQRKRREEAQRIEAEEKRKKQQKRIQQQKRKQKQQEQKRKKEQQQRKRKEEQAKKLKQAEQKRKKDEEAKKKLEEQKKKKEQEENKRKAEQQKKKKQALEKEQRQKEQVKRKQQEQAKNKKTGKGESKKSAINYGELDDELIDEDEDNSKNIKNVPPAKRPTKKQDDQYLQEYDDDFDEFSPDKEEHDQGEAPKTQQLIEEENLKSLNEYMKGTSYARKNKPNLQAFNNKTQYAYLFEEFTQNGKFYIYTDSSISKAIYDFGKELQDQNVPEQNLQLTLETIQEAITEDHIKTLNEEDIGQQTRLIFPLSFNNDLNIYLVEVIRSEQYIIIIFKEEPPKKQEFQFKLSSFIEAFRHLYGIQDPQLVSIVVTPETKAVLQTFDKELPNLLLIFALHYEQEHNMTSPIIINQYTIQRFFYILHILQPLYDVIMNEEEKIQEFFDKLGEKYQNGQKMKTLLCQADINEEQEQNCDAKISAATHKFKEDFLKNKTAKHQFAMIELLNSSEEESVQFRKIVVYFSMTKEDAGKPTLNYFIVSSNDEEQQFASKLFEWASDQLDEKFERTIYMDYSRHNGLSEYSEWSLSLWPHVVEKRKMSPLQAFRAMTLAMTPYYMALKSLD